jgi:hypothetical protein
MIILSKLTYLIFRESYFIEILKDVIDKIDKSHDLREYIYELVLYNSSDNILREMFSGWTPHL